MGMMTKEMAGTAERERRKGDAFTGAVYSMDNKRKRDAEAQTQDSK
jgi:hypothetical protein